MKKLFIIPVLICLLSSCTGSESVKSTKEYPFVVAKIESLPNGQFRYTKAHFESAFTEFLAFKKQSITLDKKLNIQIGDTLKFN